MTQIDSYYPKSVFLQTDSSLPTALERLADAGGRLRAVLETLDDEALRSSPVGGKWSPAEVSDHLILATGLLAKVVVRACGDRSPPVMPKGELSSEGKPVSPPLVVPRTGRAREELVADLRQTVEDLERAVRRASDLGKLDRVALSHSFFGELSVLECLQMAGWHFEHHLRQLQRDFAGSVG
ncbi:MAG: DinB family protein [Trueperaceae bacterium]